MERDEKHLEDSEFTMPGSVDPFTAGEAMLERAKSVSQRITERVRELTGDTHSHASLPNDPTDVQSPLAD